MNTEPYQEVDEIFSEFLRHQPVPTISYAIVQGGTLLHTVTRHHSSLEGGSLTDVGQRARTTTDHGSVQFRIASMTKSFAAAAILILRDENKLALTDQVGTILGGVKLSERLRQLTVHQLLTMSADLPTDDPWGDRKLGSTDDEYAALYGDEYSNAGAGASVCSYSNLGYMILGRILSKVSGQHAHHYIEQRLLQPLAMSSTSWNPIGEPVAYAKGHQPSSADGTTRLWRELPRDSSRGDGDVFAGLWTTAADLAKWLHFLHELRDNSSVLSAASRLEMQQGSTFMSDGYLVPWRTTSVQRQRQRYCMGLASFQIADERYVGHSGGLPGYGSHMRWHCGTGLGIVALANTTYASVTLPATRALEYLVRTEIGASPVSLTAPSTGAVERAAESLTKLLEQWQDAIADELFAENFFLDTDREECRGALERVAQHIALLDEPLKVQPLSPVRGELRCGSRSSPIIEFSLSPGMRSQIQKLTVRIFDGARAEIDAVLKALPAALASGDGYIEGAATSAEFSDSLKALPTEQRAVLRSLHGVLGAPVRILSTETVTQGYVTVRLSGTFGQCQLELLFDEESGYVLCQVR